MSVTEGQIWGKYHQDMNVPRSNLAISWIHKNIERHTTHTIVSWPNPKQWIIVHVKWKFKSSYYWQGIIIVVFSCDQAALQMVFSVRPSVRLSVRLSHLFHYVPIIVSSWNFQELLPMTKVRSMQKVKVRGQRSRSQRSKPNLTVSGL